MAIQVLRDAESVARFQAHWNERIDQLASGALGGEEFIAEMLRQDRDARDYPWAVIAIMDRRVRRGQLAEDLFRGIEARIAQREFALESELTVDMPAPPPRHVTQRIRQLSAEQLAVGQSANDAPPAPPVPVVSELAAGTILNDRYVIRSVVGEGGMARIYQALDQLRREQGDIDSHVAIKVLRESTQNHAEGLTRLTREFETTRQLKHRNIIRVFEMGRDGPLDFFTMEILQGELLSKFLDRFHGEPLPRDEAWSMIRDIGSALAHAHAAGVVHGDLQPQNIMMLESGDLKLMDFGAGTAGDINQVTPGYASLEQLSGLAPHPRDDLYALACLSYELLAGTHPYGHRRASEARSLGLTPALPRGLNTAQWRLLKQALAFERASRPASVRDWLVGLGLESARPVPVAVTSEPPTAEPSPVLIEHTALIERPVAEQAAIEHAEIIERPAVEQDALEHTVFIERPASEQAVVEQAAPIEHPAATHLPVERPAIEQAARIEHPRHEQAAAPAETAWREETALPEAVAATSPAKPVPAKPWPVAEIAPAEPTHEQAAAAHAAMDALFEPTVEITAVTPPTISPAAPRYTVEELAPLAPPAGRSDVARPAVRAAAKPRAVPGVPPRMLLGAAGALLVLLGGVAWHRWQASANRAVSAVAVAPSPPVTPAPEAVPVATAPKTPVTPARAAVRPAPKPVPAAPSRAVTLTSKTYRAAPGARFVEIKVSRADASKPLNFTWWTEDGSARAGVDYVATAKSTGYIAAGARSASLFVKIVNAPRRQPLRFAVQIAKPSIGVLGDARATVTLEAGR